MFLFITEIFCFFIQIRRQDFATGSQNHKGEIFFKYNIGCMKQPGGQI